MTKYRKIPVEIEAKLFTGTLESAARISTWLDVFGAGYQIRVNDEGMADLYIITLEGVMHVSSGDYVIQGVQGEFYPCKPDIFNQTYVPVE